MQTPRAEVAPGTRRAVLVEGVSDRAALLALARRQGRELDEEGIEVLAMGGATSIGRFVPALGADGLGLELTGLCDQQEEPVFRRWLHSYSVCVRDLEDELIRALTPDGVERVLAELGDLELFRVFQNQPYQRTRTIEQQLHRFIGTTAGRKEQYARAFVEGLHPDAVPEPLTRAITPG
jgi:hypothetical protein